MSQVQLASVFPLVPPPPRGMNQENIWTAASEGDAARVASLVESGPFPLFPSQLLLTKLHRSLPLDPRREHLHPSPRRCFVLARRDPTVPRLQGRRDQHGRWGWGDSTFPSRDGRDGSRRSGAGRGSTA